MGAAKASDSIFDSCITILPLCHLTHSWRASMISCFRKCVVFARGHLVALGRVGPKGTGRVGGRGDDRSQPGCGEGGERRGQQLISGGARVVGVARNARDGINYVPGGMTDVYAGAETACEIWWSGKDRTDCVGFLSHLRFGRLLFSLNY